jgi:hypothetical protein
VIDDRSSFGRLAPIRLRSGQAVTHHTHKRQRAPISVGRGSPLHAIFLKIMLTRFRRFRYKGVPPLGTGETDYTTRNQVATPYSASTTAPLSLKLIR